MASEFDTLNIGNLRLRKEFPIAGVQQAEDKAAASDPVRHPEAAAAARARIAALPESYPLAASNTIPMTPTVDLVTDRQLLAAQANTTPTVTQRRLPSIVRPMLTAIGIFALVLLTFKAPVIYSQISYTLSGKKATQTQAATTASSVIPAQNSITIPKINVHAPVQYEPSIVETDVQRALQDGVVHYGNTAVPGQNGNTAIFGHSSNDWWEPGNYKFVFVLLDKLVPGDRFTIDYQSTRYTYEVTGSKIVEPTDVSVLNPTATPTVTLITCTPPGTSLRRLIVTAKQVDPNPAKATAATVTGAAKADQSNLPSAAPGLFDQISRAWSGITHGFMSLFGGDKTDTPKTSSSPSPGSLPTAK